MRVLETFAVLLLAGLASSNPIAESNILRITESFFNEATVIYTGKDDIVKIFTPLNALNFDDDSDSEDTKTHIFFIEKSSNGNTLYILIENEPTKLLENANDIAASSDETKQVFVGAADGIYVYNAEKNAVEKYGTVTDNVIAIAKENGTDVIYYANDKFEVYKVTEDGAVKHRITKIKDARQIILDFQNNLFYVDGDNHVHVYVDEEVRKIKGLPSNPTYVQLLRPPFVLEEAVPVVVGKKAFTAYLNGTSEFSDIAFSVVPTAYSMEATLIQYYGYNKKIYEFNILAIILGGLLEELQNFFKDQTEQIQAIATRSRKDFGA